MTPGRVERHRGRTVAYFSMEVGLEPSLPTYSGGLGVLAGDTLKAAADLGVPMVAVTLLHRKGYLKQQLDENGNQTAEPESWKPEDLLDLVPTQATIHLEGRPVQVAAWRRIVRGSFGNEVPVYFLDTDVEGNAPEHRALTDRLYGGDARYRLQQEAVLGLGGVALLRALGFGRAVVHHMNEGHSALLTLALLAEQAGLRGLLGSTELDSQEVRRRCVFTTHTPVPAGHDVFPLDMVAEVLGAETVEALTARGWCLNGELNMTYLALTFSRFINGVAMRHGQVSRTLFPGYPINSITNGVHARTWTCPAFTELFDRHLPQWRTNTSTLRHALGIPLSEVAAAHADAKAALLAEVERRVGVTLRPDALTVGFARRATEYKRADLLFWDRERLRALAREVGPIQAVYAGKAHPHDGTGQDLIRRIVEAGRDLGDDMAVVYLPGYDMTLGGLMTSGSDIWLNTPRKPHEASGTSGMKAALNGVPSVSVLDGWWIEGCIDGVTGWSIGDGVEPEADEAREATSLLDKLEHAILPLYHGDPDGFTNVRRNSIALNGSHFHAHRMVHQYVRSAYEVAYGLPVREPV